MEATNSKAKARTLYCLITLYFVLPDRTECLNAHCTWLCLPVLVYPFI